MQIKLETQRCVMAPSLIRSACRKSPREGGAALLIVRRHCTALLSPNDGHSSCHSTQYYYKFFSVEFASLVNLDIYCMSSPFSFFQNESCGSDLSVASEEIREEIALRQMAHTYLALVLFACCFHHEKFFPWDLVKMVSPMYFATRNVFVFLAFFLYS